MKQGEHLLQVKQKNKERPQISKNNQTTEQIITISKNNQTSMEIF